MIRLNNTPKLATLLALGLGAWLTTPTSLARPGLANPGLTKPGLARTGPTQAETTKVRSSESLYERAMRGSLERLQGELQRELELFSLRNDWTNPWRVESEHYEVRTTHSRTLGRRLARGLDVSLANMEDMLGTNYRPTRRFVMLVLPDLGTYNQFGDAVGEHHSSFYGSFYAADDPEQAVGALYDPNWTRLSMWLTHGAFHQYTAQALSANLPLWLEEGLASYYASCWDWEWTLQRFRELRQRNALIPLGDLLSTPLAGYVERTDDRLLELAVLVHYLANVREDTRMTYDEDGQVTSAPFRDYVRLSASGGNFAQQPVHALITRNLTQLERDFRATEF